MRQYEVTFIVDPVLSSDEAKATVKVYTDFIKGEGATIVNINEMGLKQLAYPINKRNTGVYYCVEFQPKDGTIVDKMELAFRRDEKIMRFLVVKLDKYGVKYNEDKRNGLIGKVKKKEPKPVEDRRGGRRDNRNRNSGPRKSSSSRSSAPAKAAPAKNAEAAKEDGKDKA